MPKLPNDRLFKDEKNLALDHSLYILHRGKQKTKLVSQVPSECEMNRKVHHFIAEGMSVN